MRWMKWIGLIATVALIILCFTTWAVIASKNIIITGVDAIAVGLGRPGYMHFLFSFFFVLFTFIPRVWAKRFNLLVTALNIAWAVRNWFVVSACSLGECPEKGFSLYLLIPFSVIMLASALFPDYDLKEKKIS
jgi:hypothetical protein